MIPKQNLPEHHQTIAADQVIPVPYFDKMVHVFLYSILYILCMFFAEKGVLKNRNPLINMAVIFYCFLYGILIEYLQLNVGREFNWHDVWANGAGIITGIVIYTFLNQHIRS
jgi:VanZ family protein